MTIHTPHPDLRRDLAAVRERLLRMGGRVEDMVARSIQAVVQKDIELARATVDLDERVDQAEIAIDLQCLRLLEHWQPRGQDLRFLTFAMKSVSDLERIGDLAASTCERAIELATDGINDPCLELTTMGHHVTGMLAMAIDAFVEADPAKAQAVIAADDELDERYHDFRRARMAAAQQANSPDALLRAIRTSTVAKYLERMGDHCTNLAEKVVFLVDGEDIRQPRASAGK